MFIAQRPKAKGNKYLKAIKSIYCPPTHAIFTLLFANYQQNNYENYLLMKVKKVFNNDGIPYHVKNDVIVAKQQ